MATSASLPLLKASDHELNWRVGGMACFWVTAARLGDRAEAARIGDELGAMEPKFRRKGLQLYWRACIYAQLGDHAAAIDDLREAYSQGLAYEISHHRDPFLEPLRGEPAFDELMQPL